MVMLNVQAKCRHKNNRNKSSSGNVDDDDDDDFVDNEKSKPIYKNMFAVPPFLQMIYRIVSMFAF